MSTQPKKDLKICVKFLGPILSLDAELTKNDQNLIFARNGAGKSFLSRAFRYLDLENQNINISDAANNLISDESLEGSGKFSVSRGGDVMGKLTLKKMEKMFRRL